MNGVIVPERIYSIRDLDKITNLGVKNIERSIKRGVIQASRLDGRFYMIKGRDFIRAVEADRKGEVRLSKPHVA